MMQLPNPVEPCLVHMSDNDPDCELCQAELAALAILNADLQRETTEAEQRLARQGVGVDRAGVLMVRLNTLIGTLFGDNPKSHALFEMAYATNIAASFKVAEAEATRQKLLQGVRLTP